MSDLFDTIRQLQADELQRIRSRPAPEPVEEPEAPAEPEQKPEGDIEELFGRKKRKWKGRTPEQKRQRRLLNRIRGLKKKSVRLGARLDKKADQAQTAKDKVYR